jgi:hypothetical protein
MERNSRLARSISHPAQAYTGRWLDPAVIRLAPGSFMAFAQLTINAFERNKRWATTPNREVRLGRATANFRFARLSADRSGAFAATLV